MQGYRAVLDAASALDFDDLLLRAVALLEGDAAGVRGVARALPVPAGRRVPGHEPDPVPARAPAGRARGQPDRGRRRGPVDLLLARGGHLEHPGLRARLPGGARLPPGAELPLQPAHPGRGRGARRAQRAAQGQDARGGEGRGRAGAAARGRGRVRGGRLGHRPHGGAAREGARGGAVPDERAEPADRRGPAAAPAPVPGGGRRRLLRAARGEGRARLPAARGEPAGRRRLPPHRQRAAARDRREDARRDRPRRPGARRERVGRRGGPGRRGRAARAGAPGARASSARRSRRCGRRLPPARAAARRAACAG